MKLRTGILSLPLLLVPLTHLGIGCGGTTTGSADMRSAGDMPGGSRTLKSLPTGCPTSETSADLYTSVVKGSCALDTCHGTNSTLFQISSAADLHNKWVGKTSTEGTNSLPYVTANDVDKSFVMYKIIHQQLANEGLPMPNNGVTLTSAQICKFIAWIESGAN